MLLQDVLYSIILRINMWGCLSISNVYEQNKELISYIEQAHYLIIILYSELCLIQTFKNLIDERLYDI